MLHTCINSINPQIFPIIDKYPQITEILSQKSLPEIRKNSYIN